MSEVVVDIIETKESEKNGIKYLNINVSNSEVERNPDIVRLCTDARILEYVKSKTGHWIKSKDQYGIFHYECSECGNDIATQSDYSGDNYCLECGARMVGDNNDR